MIRPLEGLAVLAAEAGYAGGTTTSPSYEQVSSSTTGPATGSVTPRPGFSSGVDDAYYYAVAFLTTTGYCSSGRLFWSAREAQEAAGRRLAGLSLLSLLAILLLLQSDFQSPRLVAPICSKRCRAWV